MKALKVYNAAEMWHSETNLPSVPSFSQTLDNMLGNEGVQLRSITELLGLPGSGKTQLCLQLCASVQIPQSIGGLDAEALYIDTNTNFTISRFSGNYLESGANVTIKFFKNLWTSIAPFEILNATISRCNEVLDSPLNITEEEALKRLHYVNAFGLENYCAFTHQLPQFIAEHPNVRLIAIDSIAFPFKEGISAKKRTGLLFRQMAELQRIAVQNQIAVVLTNEMSTRVGLGNGSVVGSLGDAWAHRCNKRVLLSADARQGQGCRLALLLKSNDAPAAVARFQITAEGIRDVE